VSFCRTIAARDDRPLERVPLSSLALQGHFGGWFAFLVRIGVLVDDPVSAGRDRGAPHWMRRTARGDATWCWRYVSTPL
jgi:hypothetical protein